MDDSMSDSDLARDDSQSKLGYTNIMKDLDGTKTKKARPDDRARNVRDDSGFDRKEDIRSERMKQLGMKQPTLNNSGRK